MAQNDQNKAPIIIKKVNVYTGPGQKEEDKTPNDHLKEACDQVSQAASKTVQHFTLPMQQNPQNNLSIKKRGLLPNKPLLLHSKLSN
jgi:hypothetical protein